MDTFIVDILHTNLFINIILSLQPWLWNNYVTTKVNAMNQKKYTIVTSDFA